MNPADRTTALQARAPRWARLAGALALGVQAFLPPVAGLLQGLPVPAVAQPVAGLFELRNLSTQTLRFDSFDPARRTWQPQSLAPNASLRLVWAGAGAGKVRIGAEGRGYAEFDIRGGMRYDFTWNPASHLWEMQATPRI